MSKGTLRIILAVFSLCCALAAAQTPKFLVIHSFNGKSDGSYPGAGVIVDGSGNLYGTTSSGTKYSSGTVFRIDALNKFSVLYTFTGFADGGQPRADLVRDPQGNFYGTASVGGTDNYGTLFKIDSSGQYSVLHSFLARATDVLIPDAGLILDSGGNLYGTAVTGGGHGQGGVFRLGTKGWEKVLYSFQVAPDGSGPYAALLRAKQGGLFGTTIGGGAANSGTVFKVDSVGNETVLFSFPGGAAGESPMSGLIEDSAGNMYGTTYGTTGIYPPFYYGTIFKIDANGVESVLHVFDGLADGGNPLGKLVMDSSGNLYGTASTGGAFSKGAVFKLDTGGNYTVLHNFSGKDGAGPGAGLAFDAKGALYGTTVTGGAFNQGTVFKIRNP